MITYTILTEDDIVQEIEFHEDENIEQIKNLAETQKWKVFTSNIDKLPQEDKNKIEVAKTQREILTFKQYLADTDWVSTKGAEVGFENLDDKNKAIIEKRKEARAKINELEKELEKFEVA